MRMWWNWYTRTFEGRMPHGLRVQIPPSAPLINDGRLAQLVERLVDVEKAIGSSPIPPTTIIYFQN